MAKQNTAPTMKDVAKEAGVSLGTVSKVINGIPVGEEYRKKVEQAIKELDEIKQQKLWQQGRSKEYYTLITETLRRYIVDRFDINAMEMTSGEILDIIRKQHEADSVYENLKQILNLSDFVKFAKMNPLPDENDLSMVNAYLFINQTKIEEVAVPEAETDGKATETNDSNITKE